jgi:transcriptional regulator with XRE-family HTH domain/anti-sigma regulatory factor (Ser/Thr protein kinase)
MAENVVSLGERLRLRREELGISQAQAARELDVARTAYRLWEMEAAKPAPDRWRLISRWLGVSVATMLLAEEMIDAQESKGADALTARLGARGIEWDAGSMLEEGSFFEQERTMIAKQTARGSISHAESVGLGGVVDRVESEAWSAPSRAWRSAQLHKDLPKVDTAPQVARAAVLVTAAGIPEEHLGDAQLLTSELVTNSVQHVPGADDVALRISVGREVLRVEVEDSGGKVRPRTPDTAGGWGLTLVMEIASRWGTGRMGAGNVTWFEIDLPRPGEPPQTRRG